MFIVTTAIDFLLFYILFSYQRTTLNIARQMGESSGGKRIAEIQAMLTPMLISSLGWFTWATLAAACYFLWSEEWWYVAIYLVVRFVFVGLLPLPSWKGYVMNRVKKMKPTEFIGLTKQ